VNIDPFAPDGVAPDEDGIQQLNASSLTDKISQFNAQNLSPGQIFSTVQSLPQTVGGIPGVGPIINLIPGLGKTPIPGLSSLPKILAPLNQLRGLAGFFDANDGKFTTNKYAVDLNAHHPKLKFLFKVGFRGFGIRNFYYFIHRCDKPKIKFNHTDVNYYNFRTRVLTSTTFEPLTMTFLDEIGNSVNEFFANYLKRRSGQGNGQFGIDKGFGEASSSKPYENAYSSGLRNSSTGTVSGTEIVVEQIFANGLYANRFNFINPRIEAFDFDELSMEESAGSLLTCTFTYDALRCETVGGEKDKRVPIYTWGQTDLKKGGGTSGPENAGATSATERGTDQATAGAGGMGGYSDQEYVDAETRQYELQAEYEARSNTENASSGPDTRDLTSGVESPAISNATDSAGEIISGSNQENRGGVWSTDLINGTAQETQGLPYIEGGVNGDFSNLIPGQRFIGDDGTVLTAPDPNGPTTVHELGNQVRQTSPKPVSILGRLSTRGGLIAGLRNISLPKFTVRS